MPQLATLKAEIDAGKTAKLMHPVNRPGGIVLTIRIKREHIADREGYAWQYTTPGKTTRKTRHPLMVFHPTWEALLTDIEGMQTITSDWQLCDDALEPYVPERKMLPTQNA